MWSPFTSLLPQMQSRTADTLGRTQTATGRVASRETKVQRVNCWTAERVARFQSDSRSKILCAGHDPQPQKHPCFSLARIAGASDAIHRLSDGETGMKNHLQRRSGNDYGVIVTLREGPSRRSARFHASLTTLASSRKNTVRTHSLRDMPTTRLGTMNHLLSLPTECHVIIFHRPPRRDFSAPPLPCALSTCPWDF